MDDLYGRMKALVAAALMPTPVIVGLVMCGLVLLGLGYQGVGVYVMAGGTVLLALASWWPVAEGLLSPLENRHPPLAAAAALDGVVAVVVLGGIWWPDARWPISSQLGESTAIRLLEGVRLLRTLPGARLIVSGASWRGRLDPVARGYAQAAEELGVPPNRILKLESPMDTGQEAEAVRTVLGMTQPFVLVTSASHMPRAVAHFRMVGLDPIPAPTERLTGRATRGRLEDWLPSATQLRYTELACYQYLGLLALRWEHRARV